MCNASLTEIVIGCDQVDVEPRDRQLCIDSPRAVSEGGAVGGGEPRLVELHLRRL